MLTDEVGGNFIAVRVGDFKIETEDFVVADFEARDSRLFANLLLIFGDPVFATFGQIPQVVEI